MQKLVGAVGVALGAQHAAHHHLGLRKALAEHVHQRDGAALADVATGCAKVRLRGFVERLLEPWRGGRGVPARGAATPVKSNPRLVGRVVFEQGFELLHGLGGIHQRRQAQAELEGGVGAQHVAGVLQRRKALGAGHTQRGLPGALEQCLQRVGGGGQRELGRAAAVVVRPGKALVHLVSQNGGRGAGLGLAVGGHLAVKAGGQQAASGAVFEPVEHLAHDAKRRRHQARSIARVDAFGEDLNLERAAGHAAQAGGEPQLVVVTGAAVQADHQPHIAQAGAQGVDVGQQIARAAFLAGFDEAHDARVRHVLALEFLHGGNAGVHGIAIVRATAAVELAVFVLGRPGAEVAAPAGKLGLLVEVAIHQHRLGGGGLGGLDLEEEHRCAAGQAHDLQAQTGHFLRLDPGGSIAHHGIEQTQLRPVGGKGGRLGRNGDVFGELAQDVVIPRLADPLQCQRRLKDLGGDSGVHGRAPAAIRKPHSTTTRPRAPRFTGRRLGRPRIDPRSLPRPNSARPTAPRDTAVGAHSLQQGP